RLVESRALLLRIPLFKPKRKLGLSAFLAERSTPERGKGADEVLCCWWRRQSQGGAQLRRDRFSDVHDEFRARLLTRCLHLRALRGCEPTTRPSIDGPGERGMLCLVHGNGTHRPSQ